MENLNNHQTITPESVLASVKEMFAASTAEAEKRSAKFDQGLEKSREAWSKTTAEVKEMFAELRETQATSSAKFNQELAASSAKFEQEMAASSAKFDQEMAASRAEFDKRSAKFDQKMEKLSDTIGSWSNNHGFFAEEYFFNSFNNGKQNFFGETYDEIKKNLKGIETDDEFDVVMLNGHSVGLVEVKFKAHENDLPKILKKAHAFKTNFPKYQNHKVYLGLATMAFYPKLEEECIKEGIAIVKQVGDTIIINEEHLKAF